MKNLNTTIVTASLALCLIGLAVGEAAAFNGIARDWRDQYPDACATLPTQTARPEELQVTFGPSLQINPTHPQTPSIAGPTKLEMITRRPEGVFVDSLAECRRRLQDESICPAKRQLPGF